MKVLYKRTHKDLIIIIIIITIIITIIKNKVIPIEVRLVGRVTYIRLKQPANTFEPYDNENNKTIL